MTGHGGGILEGCDLFDLDTDRDVDLSDVERFQRAFTGAG